MKRVQTSIRARRWLAVLLVGWNTTLARADEAVVVGKTKPSPEAAEFFESKIRPLLIQRCVECHNDDEPESGLSLQSHAGLLRGGKLGPAVNPGKPKESLLVSAINHDEFLKMPPKEKLPTAELVLLTQWVSMGAPWPSAAPATSSPKGADDTAASSSVESVAARFTDEQKAFWAYRPLHRPNLPGVGAGEGIDSPIDGYVRDKLQAKGLAPAAPASKRDLIRRATYDLIGLPPTEAEIERFVGDSSPNAFSKVLDRLLASPRYGERWGRHWLDVARFADSNGLDENIAYANAYRYRDYVISSFNGDKTYDRFVQEQIAGDLLEPRPDQCGSGGEEFDRYVATGFLAIGAKMLAEDDPLKMQMDIIDEQLSVLCQAFMGMTIGCARCHDHKFDPIPTADYYALAGIFKSTQTMEHHKVVAKWFERPLAAEAEVESMRAIDREIESAKAEIDKLNKECRERVAKQSRQSVGNALLATVQYDRFEALSKDKLAKGLEQKESAYRVDAGYALIEAEGFQRGTVVRDTENYGKGIGVIISHGGSYAEYDLQVERAGQYALELRYASADRRPVQLVLDEKELNPNITDQTTGGWQPEAQAWFVGGVVELSAGKHVLRFESRRVIPHIDKFALVFQTSQAWPFGVEPVALSRTGIDLGVGYGALKLWRNYLEGVRKRDDDDLGREPFFALWPRFREIANEFEPAAKQICAELEADSPLAKQTPPPLRDALLAARPTTLEQVAAAFQIAVDRVFADDAADDDRSKEYRKELASGKSPLGGPSQDFEQFCSSDEQTRADELQASLTKIEGRRPNPPMAMGVTESKPEDLKIHLRGSHLVQGALVPRRFPQILTSATRTPIQESASGRLEFARWMTRHDHPLTARVMANRVWHWHFGRGIVSSVDNFGFLGQKPSHPELLDWLASELVEGDWSIKQLHKTIMLSQTYQMSGQFSAKSAEADPENEFLWHFKRRRLTGEETRDSILAVGGGVDQTMYGSLMKVENHKYVNSTGSPTALNYDNARRSVYLPVIRSGVFDVLQTMDFPDPAMSSGDRQTSTVAPQALLMMNSDLVHDQTRVIAEQLLGAPLDDAQRISAAYRRLLNRSPSIEEIVAAATFLRDARSMRAAKQEPSQSDDSLQLAWQGLCRVLISSNEFSYVE